MRKNVLALFTLLAAFALGAGIFIYDRAAKTHYHSDRAFIADTVLEATIEAREREFKTLFAEIIDETRRVGLILNPHNPESEIAKVNKRSHNGETTIALSKELAQLLSLSRDYSARSDGAYDITVRPLLTLWGFGSGGTPHTPDAKAITNALKNVGWRSYRVEGTNLVLLKPGLTFDLGASGKGYILSLVRKRLLERGKTNFLVYFGGDVLTHGVNKKGAPWAIGVRDPRTNGVLQTEYRTNGAIVTSGDYERAFVTNGVRYHHIIDARTGRPSIAAISATIIHDDPLHADILSTVLFLEGTNFFRKGYAYEKAILIVGEDEERTVIESP